MGENKTFKIQTQLRLLKETARYLSEEDFVFDSVEVDGEEAWF